MASFIAGFITSLLAGLGIGGGGLLVIYLAFFTGIKQLTAQGINLIFFIFSSAASMLIHLRKRKIPFLTVLIIASFGAIGAAFGSICAMSADPNLIKRCFGALLVISGVLAVFK